MSLLNFVFLFLFVQSLAVALDSRIATRKFFSPHHFNKQLPVGTKIGCYSGIHFLCQYVQLKSGGQVYALSYLDDRLSFAITLYDSHGNIMKTMERKGARLIKRIEINHWKKEVTFIGKGNKKVKVLFSNFATGMIFVKTGFLWNMKKNGDAAKSPIADKLCLAQKVGLSLTEKDLVLSCYVERVNSKKKIMLWHRSKQIPPGWTVYYIQSFLRDTNLAKLINQVNNMDNSVTLIPALKNVGILESDIVLSSTFASIKTRYIDENGNSIVDYDAVKKILELLADSRQKRKNRSGGDEKCLVDMCWKSVFVLDRAHPVIRFTYPNGKVVGCRGGPKGPFMGPIITACGEGKKSSKDEKNEDSAEVGLYDDLHQKYDDGDCIPVPGPCNYDCYKNVIQKIEDMCIAYKVWGPNCATVIYKALLICSKNPPPDGGKGFQPGYWDFPKKPELDAKCKSKTKADVYMSSYDMGIGGGIILLGGLGIYCYQNKRKNENIEYEHLLDQVEDL